MEVKELKNFFDLEKVEKIWQNLSKKNVRIFLGQTRQRQTRRKAGFVFVDKKYFRE
jgi:hypothetical protein